VIFENLKSEKLFTSPTCSLPLQSRYDFIVEKSSAVDRTMSIVCEKHVLIHGCRVLKRSIHRSEIGLNSVSSFFKLCSN
jgi:hypothetical protein